MNPGREMRVGRTDVSEARHPAPGLLEDGDEGYVLLAVLVMIFLMLLVLTIAAPKMAMELKHDQEIETAHRANQYVRAIRMFHKKTGNYPTSIEQLEKTSNQRFLRQRYIDPLTGKDDWRMIQVGQNKTNVKGFFGKDLPGMPPGLGSAAGMASSPSGTSSPGAFGSSSGSSFGSSSGSSFGSSTPSSGSGSSFGTGSAFGSSPAGSTGGTTGASGTGGATSSGPGTGTGTGTNGIKDTDASDYSGSTGPIMGVGVPKSGEAFLSVNGVSTYDQWEFLYDPRIEQMYAQSNLLGGGGALNSGTGTSGVTSTSLSGLGSMNNPGGAASSGTSGSGTGGSGSSGSGTSGSGTSTNPPASPPQ